MSELDRHIKGPDIGVMSSDLFIYDAKRPGTGGLVTVVFPAQLEERAVEFVKTQDLQITFCLTRAANTAEVALTHKTDPPSVELQTFQLTPEFQTEKKVSLTVLFSEWKIVALIDGEPLKKKK
jgi:hypothetical protein